MMLAGLFQVDHAPFFIVETKEHGAQVYTVYLKFVKEILESTAA